MLKKLAVISAATAIAFAPAVLAPMAAVAKPTAKALECAKEANAKGLHGKTRQKFVIKCEKARL
jgi:hypothetical protein